VRGVGDGLGVAEYLRLYHLGVEFLGGGCGGVPFFAGEMWM